MIISLPVTKIRKAVPGDQLVWEDKLTVMFYQHVGFDIDKALNWIRTRKFAVRKDGRLDKRSLKHSWPNIDYTYPFPVE